MGGRYRRRRAWGQIRDPFLEPLHTLAGVVSFHHSSEAVGWRRRITESEMGARLHFARATRRHHQGAILVGLDQVRHRFHTTLIGPHAGSTPARSCGWDGALLLPPFLDAI
jgi:hypothetical protein